MSHQEREQPKGPGPTPGLGLWLKARFLLFAPPKNPGTMPMHAGHAACRGDGLSAPTRHPGARDQPGAQSSPAPSPEAVSRSAHPCAQGWGSSMPHSNAEPGDGREGDTAQPTLRPQPLDHCLGQGPPAPGTGMLSRPPPDDGGKTLGNSQVTILVW